MGLEVNKIFEDFLSKKSIFSNKDALTIKYTPENIPHRENEITALAKVLAPVLRMERPSNVFLYGKTGTGKSLVTTYVCSELQKIAKQKNIPLKIIFINCKMRKVADTEYRLIAQLAREFGYEIPATGLPTDEVYKIFFDAIDRDRSIIVLVLDEIDQLVKKAGDEVLYNLTRINQELKNAKLSIVGISNDVMFTKNLDPRVKSSLSEEEMVFPPYDALQLKDILKERAKIAFNENVIDEAVIAKCAAYAAREHGDARRALDLLRVAGEIAERLNKDKIEEEDVDAAEEKIETETIEQLVKKLPRQSQAVLYSAILILKSRDPPIYTGEIFDVYKGICVRIGMKYLTQRRVSDLISELDMLGIITAKVISKGRYGRTREISITANEDIVNRIEALLKNELGI
ncbi:MAG: ORC1-type DNA replication protein [Candidatus Aenigmarchaeota archaeon]|nr:ORC1-type DNA replication protein [Candidatus Aenigmarchaeota archaeon]